jgi:hypothetical protein
LRLIAGITRGILLKPALNLLCWILKRNGNSIIIGGPLGWSWETTLDTTHHGALAGPANAHRHSDLASIGIDDHHARDHATRHHSGGGDALALGSIAGNLTDAQHGSRTVANAHAHSHLSGVGVNDHHNRDHAATHAVGGADALSVGTPAAIGASNAEGSATNFARRDHVHAHGATVRCDGNFSAIDMRIRCRTADPATPADGELWLRTDL